MACCPRNRFNWAACSCTWRMVYKRSSKKLIGSSPTQGKSTCWCACSSDNPAIAAWHFLRRCTR